MQISRQLGSIAASAQPSVRVLAHEGDHGGTLVRDALRARGVDAELWSPDVAARVARRERDEPLPHLLLAHHHDLGEHDLATLERLHRRGVEIANPLDGTVASRDKAVTAERFARNGVPHPPTIAVSRAAEVRAAVEQLAQPGVPVFLKNPVGTQGIGVAGLRDAKEAIAVGELVTAHGDRPLLVQAGIPVADGAELVDTRVFVVDGRAVAAMDRVQRAGGDVRTGLHSGAVGRPRELTRELRETAERAAASLGLHDVAGVDVLGGKVLEANYAPGHRIAEVTGVDVTGRLADHLAERARRAAASGLS